MASYVPGELIPLPSSGSIPELPHVAKLFCSCATKFRPVCAVRMTAGHNALRGSGPGRIRPERNPYLEGLASAAQHVLDCPIDVGSQPSAALIVNAAAVSHAGEHQSVLDAANRVLVLRQPGNRADRTGHEQDAGGIAVRSRCQNLGEARCHGDRREVIVASAICPGSKHSP
jgi:hypothetical protein